MADKVFAKKVIDRLAELVINRLVWNGSAEAKVPPHAFEKDGRKQKKLLSDLAKDGWLSEDGTITLKAYNDLEAAEPDWAGEWDISRGTWNEGKDYDFVLFDGLTLGEKKWVYQNRDKLQFYLAADGVIGMRWGLSEKTFRGPFTLEEVWVAENRHNFDDIVIKCDVLTAHVDKVLAEETFERAYRNNLAWGLVKAGVIEEGVSDLVSSKDDRVSLIADYGNLGNDPEKWGEVLAQNAENLRSSIARRQKLLDVLTKVQSSVTDWTAFRADYRAKLAEQIRLNKEKQG